MPERSEQYVPFSSARVEKISDLPAFFVDDIALEPDLQKFLFGEAERGSAPGFDYIDFSLKELSGEITLDDMLAAYPEHSDEEREAALDWFLSRAASEGSTFFLIQSLQDIGFYLNILKYVFNDTGFNHGNDPYLQEFLETIRRQPEKPFLVVTGHGAASRKKRTQRSWFICDLDSKSGVPLSRLFSHLDMDRYSAVLLVTCNEANLRPPYTAKVPGFYVNGLSAEEIVKNPQVAYPAEEYEKKMQRDYDVLRHRYLQRHRKRKSLR